MNVLFRVFGKDGLISLIFICHNIQINKTEVLLSAKKITMQFWMSKSIVSFEEFWRENASRCPKNGRVGAWSVCLKEVQRPLLFVIAVRECVCIWWQVHEIFPNIRLSTRQLVFVAVVLDSTLLFQQLCDTELEQTEWWSALYDKCHLQANFWNQKKFG